jgi:hypothetical protein
MALPWWWEDVAATMDAHGVPIRAWLPIVLSESGGYAGATNLVPPDESYGLFQENRAGGMGKGQSPLALYTPATAAEIAANNLAPAYKKYGLNWWKLSQAGWPGGTVAANDPRVTIKQTISQAIGNPKSEEEAWDRTAKWHSPKAYDRPPGVPGSGTVDPGDPADPGSSWTIPELIGGAAKNIAQEATSGLLQGIQNAAIEHAASWTFGGLGVLLIVAGVFGLALNAAASKPGRAATSVAAVASGHPEAAAALSSVADSKPDRVIPKAERGVI